MAGAIWVEFHDSTGRVEVADLSENGISVALYQCAQMTEELHEAEGRLADAEEEPGNEA